MIDTNMMEAMGLVRVDNRGRVFLNQLIAQPQVEPKEEVEKELQKDDLNDVMQRLDNLEL